MCLTLKSLVCLRHQLLVEVNHRTVQSQFKAVFNDSINVNKYPQILTGSDTVLNVGKIKIFWAAGTWLIPLAEAVEQVCLGDN